MVSLASLSVPLASMAFLRASARAAAILDDASVHNEESKDVAVYMCLHSHSRGKFGPLSRFSTLSSLLYKCCVQCRIDYFFFERTLTSAENLKMHGRKGPSKPVNQKKSRMFEQLFSSKELIQVKF